MGNNKKQPGTEATSGPCRGRSGLSEKSQSALQNYKSKRAGTYIEDLEYRPAKKTANSPGAGQLASKVLLLFLLLPMLGFFGWHAYQNLPGDPLELTYEVDLSDAHQGTLLITLMAEGKLPPELNLEFPSGIMGKSNTNLRLLRQSAHGIKDNGQMGKPLAVDMTAQGWTLDTRGMDRIGFIYQVDLAQTRSSEADVRKHISTSINGGVRFAGFEVFLEPANAPVGDITVTVYNPSNMPILVPWPALVRNDLAQPETPSGPVATAHLGFGQGYKPGSNLNPQSNNSESAENPRMQAAPVPRNLFYHPHDLADLNNALVVCGNLRNINSQAGDCVIQYATDRDWLFQNGDAVDLIRRIARTEMGFFGSHPTEQITVLLSANSVNTEDDFDIYGVHTGSSILIMLDEETTWGLLENEAASVIAHEMFHGWLGEAITQVDPSTLWFTEGATTWYSARMLTAAGIWTSDHARQVLAERLNRDYVQNPWRENTSIADAAADVMGDPQKVRFSYAGGVAASMALDQWLARQCNMARPLDEILRYLYKNTDEEGFSRESLEAAVLAVTGVDCHLWLEEHVYGTLDLPPLDRLI